MKTFEENQLIICDQLKEPVKYFPGICDHDGYVWIEGFGKVHIDNFTAHPCELFKDKMGNEIEISPITSAREEFTKNLNESWHNAEFKMPSNFLKDNGDPMTVLEMLIDLNYQAVRDRGLINDETDFYDFMEKLEEESEELAWAFLTKDAKNNETKKHFDSELIDCISVLLNMAKHYNIDVIEGLKQNIIKNQERAKNKQ